MEGKREGKKEGKTLQRGKKAEMEGRKENERKKANMWVKQQKRGDTLKTVDTKRKT